MHCVVYVFLKQWKKYFYLLVMCYKLLLCHEIPQCNILDRCFLDALVISHILTFFQSLTFLLYAYFIFTCLWWVHLVLVRFPNQDLYAQFFVQ